MTPKQENHLLNIKAEFTLLVDEKYRAGAAEHGGELLQLSQGCLLDEAIAEAVDLVVYLLSIKQMRRDK